MVQISDYELELMKIIWANGDTALYAEIAAGLEAKDNIWTKNTIITLLSRLVEKGALKTQKIGRKNKYTAVLSAAQYRSEQTLSFVKKVYEGDMTHLLATLVDKNMLSPSDYAALVKQWQEGAGEP